jgi:2'-5' RNA ligase
MAQPLVLTLRLDATSEKLLTILRTRYFHQARNHLSPHITLFHALPASSYHLTKTALSSISSREQSFTVGIKNPFLLGMKGVGINIASQKLRILHKEMTGDLVKIGIGLTEQDQRKIGPHVTVQNKVGEEEARTALEELKGTFEERAGKAEEYVLWRYGENGEWTHLRDFPFTKT